ncbi:MORN repeat-containing protein [Brevibacillus sp. 179-C9.3 HS]|uniref:MORN repeat-containing protein n=1 Tax=unclassified Brevibacillus TaxID=2684853 RepID=UPI0039A2F9CE
MDKQLQKLTEQTIVDPLTNPLKKWVQDWLKKGAALPKKALDWIKNGIAGLFTKKETSLHDYVHIGRFYIAKRFLILMGLFLLVLAYFLFINPPDALNRYLQRPIVIHLKNPNQQISDTGLAIIYNPEGTMIYSGQLVDGLYDGKGELYDENGKLLYSGEFKTGTLQGLGKGYRNGVLVYHGGFESGVYAGQGTLYNENQQVVLQGIFKNGKLDGAGQEMHTNGAIKYEGAFQNGVYNGSGRLFTQNGQLLYDGMFDNGFYGGEGTDYYGNGLVQYKGQFLDGRYNGAGSLFDRDGKTVYEGHFRNGHFNGAGTKFSPNGSIVYQGDFFLGVYHGQGELRDASGVTLYKGGFAEGHYHGAGELRSAEDALLYQGQFRAGAYDGIGVLYDKEGLPLYKGYFREGRIYLPGFIGTSKSKLEEIMGKPDDDAPKQAEGAVTPPSEPQALEAQKAAETTSSPQKITYREMNMAFTLDPAPGHPGKQLVTAVHVYHPQIISIVKEDRDELDSKAAFVPKTSTSSVNRTQSITSYLVDPYLYLYFYQAEQNKPVQLDVKKAEGL